VHGGFFLGMGYNNGITSEGLHAHGPDGGMVVLPPSVCEGYASKKAWDDEWEPKLSSELHAKMLKEHDSKARQERAVEALNGAWAFFSTSFQPGTVMTFYDWRVQLVVAEINSALFDEPARDEGYRSALERARELAALACEMGLIRILPGGLIEFLDPPRRTRDEPDFVPRKKRGVDNRSDLAAGLR
jgi:hypothetical protein